MTQLYIGVDLHKRSSTWVGIDPDHKEVLNVRCPVQLAAVKQLLARLPAPAEEIKLAIEPVCGWRWIHQCCEERGIQVYPANPKALYEIAHSHKKTDANDARSLANLLQAGYLPPAYYAPEALHRLRRAVRHRSVLVSQRTALQCRIQAICTAEGAHRTAERPTSATGRKLIEQAGDQYPELGELFALADDLTAYIAQAESVISDRLADAPELAATAELVKTMPGIGDITAAVIVAEVGDFGRFPSAKHLVSYAGLHPIVRASGERRASFHLSKRGSRFLRGALVDAATRVRDRDGARHLYAYYDRMVTVHGKSRLEARVALAHKMLVGLWFMVNRGEPYSDLALQSAQSGVSPNTLPGA